MWNDNTSDYFKFTLGAANKLVRIHVNNAHMWEAGEDLKLCILNASGTQIKCSDNAPLQDEIVELRQVDPGTYYAVVMQKSSWDMDPAQYCIVVETDAAPLPSAELHIPVDIQGSPGAIIYAPVVLDNTQPDQISSMSIGVQFDPAILEPMGVSNAGLTLGQGDAQVRYARSTNTISVSMDNFSTVQSGDLLKLIFQIKPGVAVGSASALTVIASTLNGAVVPATDGLATVSP